MNAVDIVRARGGHRERRARASRWDRIPPKVRSPDDVIALADRLSACSSAGPASSRPHEDPADRDGDRRQRVRARRFRALRAAARGALTWGAEGTSRSRSDAAANVDERGEWLPPMSSRARRACSRPRRPGVPAIPTRCVSPRGTNSASRAKPRPRGATASREVAIHPAQVEVLNRTFRPGCRRDRGRAARRRSVRGRTRRRRRGARRQNGRPAASHARARRTLRVAAALAGRNGAQSLRPRQRRLTLCRFYGRWITLPTRALADHPESGVGSHQVVGRPVD